MPPTAPQEPEDPFLEEQIERALAPYRHLLPPDDLAFFREELLMVAETHPAVAPLVDRLRQRRAASSHDTSRHGTPVPVESQTRPRQAKRGGGR